MSFQLKTADSDKVKSVFDSLDSISNNLGQNSCHDLPENKSKRKQCDSTFKVPHLPKKYRRSQAPDYVNNPDKWTRYSMKDVHCLSDSENKKIGLEFFHNLKKISESPVEKASPDDQIVFKKPRPVDQLPIKNTPKQVKSHGFVCPEYEVGQKKIKKSCLRNENIKRRPNEISLSHLNFQDNISED